MEGSTAEIGLIVKCMEEENICGRMEESILVSLFWIKNKYKISTIQGFGIYTWADGRIYEGQWLQGKQHGQGKYTAKDGKTGIGMWQYGKRIEWLTT